MLLGKHIVNYYKKYWFLILLGILLCIAVDFIQLYLPECLGEIVALFPTDSNFVVEEIKQDVVNISIKLLIVGVTLFVCRFSYRLCLFTSSKRIEASIRQEMFEKAMRLSRDYYHRNSVGTVMAWFTNDVETIEEFMSWGTVMMVDAVFLSIFTIIKMFILDVGLAVLSFIPMVLIVIWGALVEKFMSRKWEERQNAFDKLYDFSTENFSGIRVIKAFVKQNVEIHEFAKVAKKNKDVNISFARMSVVFDVVLEVLIGLIMSIILGFGGYLVYLTVKNEPLILINWTVTANLDAQKLVTFIGYFDTLIWPMIALGQVMTMRARAKTSLNRISNFLDANEDIKDAPDAIDLVDCKGKITFKDFSFRFPDALTEDLTHLTFEILPGEKIGIVGRVGSGKTTIANILNRFYNVDKDKVFIDDIDIMKIKLSSIHENISYVPQDNFLFSDTITGNISFSNVHMVDQDVKNAAKFAYVNQDIEGFEKGYNTVSGERGVTLSGGQKQRIAIARAYAKNSPIMILDDSVSAVDSKAEEEILKNIQEQRKGKTTIVIASRVSTVANFDKVLVLSNGQIEAFDTPENLLKISPTYQRMVKFHEIELELKGAK